MFFSQKGGPGFWESNINPHWAFNARKDNGVAIGMK
jgi:hypothetical protein